MSIFFNFVKLITFSAVVLLSGCGEQNPELSQAQIQSQSNKQEARSGVIRIPFNGPVSKIDPGLVVENNQIELVEQLFLGLTDFDQESGKVVGELATDWQVSEDGTVYTFNLRRDVKWTDGVPVTAHDVTWAIRRNFLESESPPFVILKNIQAIEEAQGQIMENIEMEFYQTGSVRTNSSDQSGEISLGVRAIDQSTVEFTLESATDDETQELKFHEFVEQQVFQSVMVGNDQNNETNTDSQKIIPTLTTEHWQKSEDGTVYTLKLPIDAQLAQGEQGLAHKMVEEIWYIFMNQENSPFDNLKNANALFVAMEEIIDNVITHFLDSGEIRLTMADSPTEQIISLGVRAIDDYTVQFTLEHANASFPALVSTEAFRPLPRHVIEQYGPEWTLPGNIQTNGSYQLKEWDKGNKIVLTKNSDYYEADQVNIREVHYLIVPESSIGFTMYQDDALDIIGGAVYLRLPQTEIPRIQTDPKLYKEMHTGTQACTEWYEFNTQKPPTDKVLVRKAMVAAIDKQLLIEIVLKGTQIPARTLVPHNILGDINQDEEVLDDFNPEQAKKWLKKAGYPNGDGFPKVVLMHPTSETHRKIAQGIKTLLKHYLNIDIEAQGVNWRHYDDTVYNSFQPKSATSPHLFRYSTCAKYPDASNWLGVFHSDYVNWLSGKNRELFDQTLDKARLAKDPVKSQQQFRRAEQILIEYEVATMPLYFNNPRFLVKPRVKGWYNKTFGGQHLRNWSLVD